MGYLGDKIAEKVDGDIFQSMVSDVVGLKHHQKNKKCKKAKKAEKVLIDKRGGDTCVDKKGTESCRLIRTNPAQQIGKKCKGSIQYQKNACFKTCLECQYKQCWLSSVE